MKRAPLALLATIVLLIGGGVWLYLSFERVTESEAVGYQGEARRNHLLAALRLVERMGMKTREVRGLADLDQLAPGGTLILARHRAALLQPQAERLLSWVSDGGYLIVEAEEYHDKDPLLDALQVMRRELRVRPSPRPSEIKLPGAAAALKVRFEHRQDLIDVGRRAAGTVQDDWSVLLLDYTHGSGRITVVNGFSFMTNATIDRNDHAEFVWQLVRSNPTAPEVAVAAWIEMPSLIAWLGEHAWQALVTGGVLLGLWLWRVIPRLGPLKPDPLPQRRRLLDHLRASGLFHWKTGAAGRLTAAAREVCLRKIARTHPGVIELPPAERIERFAALTQLSSRDLGIALGETPTDPRQFTTAIRTLQAMEERLTRKTAI